MSNQVYPTINELDDAIQAKIINAEDLSMFLDGGEVIVNSTGGKTVYRGSERDTLIEMFEVFLGIQNETI